MEFAYGALGRVEAVEPAGDGRVDYVSDGAGDPAGQLSVGFTGQHHDPASGLVHLRARDYDPATGQFTALDPAPHPAGAPYATPYHYANNRPTAVADPSGACPLCVAAGGGVVGGVVGGGVESAGR